MMGQAHLKGDKGAYAPLEPVRRTLNAIIQKEIYSCCRCGNRKLT